MTREEAIKYLERADITVGMKVKTKTAEAIEMAIKALEQKPKTGHWIKKDGYSDCSKCGSHIVTEWDYCPNCGARMLEPQERSNEE